MHYPTLSQRYKLTGDLKMWLRRSFQLSRNKNSVVLENVLKYIKAPVVLGVKLDVYI